MKQNFRLFTWHHRKFDSNNKQDHEMWQEREETNRWIEKKHKLKTKAKKERKQKEKNTTISFFFVFKYKHLRLSSWLVVVAAGEVEVVEIVVVGWKSGCCFIFLYLFIVLLLRRWWIENVFLTFFSRRSVVCVWTKHARCCRSCCYRWFFAARRDVIKMPAINNGFCDFSGQFPCSACTIFLEFSRTTFDNFFFSPFIICHTQKRTHANTLTEHLTYTCTRVVVFLVVFLTNFSAFLEL